MFSRAFFVSPSLALPKGREMLYRTVSFDRDYVFYSLYSFYSFYSLYSFYYFFKRLINKKKRGCLPRLKLYVEFFCYLSYL